MFFRSESLVTLQILYQQYCELYAFPFHFWAVKSKSELCNDRSLNEQYRFFSWLAAPFCICHSESGIWTGYKFNVRIVLYMPYTAYSRYIFCGCCWLYIHMHISKSSVPLDKLRTKCVHRRLLVCFFQKTNLIARASYFPHEK